MASVSPQSKELLAITLQLLHGEYLIEWIPVRVAIWIRVSGSKDLINLGVPFVIDLVVNLFSTGVGRRL